MKLKRRMRRALKRIRWRNVIICMIILFIFMYGLISIVQDIKSLFDKPEVKEVIAYTENIVDSVVKTDEKVEPVVKEEKVEEVKVEVNNKVSSKPYRLTSYYTGDGTGSGSCTGSGICTNQFKVNDKGWYTYKGKLVVAAATNKCLNITKGSDACAKYNTKVAGRKYFNYFDEIQVEIDGVKYDAIVLDSCGASMFVEEDRIDLFVANKSSVIDRGYKGKNMITVFAEFE